MNHYNYGPVGNQPNYWNHENQDLRDIQSKCKQFINYHVIGQMSDGSNVEGIIEDVDNEGVTMLVPEEVDDDSDDMRYGGYGGYRRRFRRFRRRRFPFRVFVFPFFVPFPYYYPYY
jgi:hypothetical protein